MSDYSCSSNKCQFKNKFSDNDSVEDVGESLLRHQLRRSLMSSMSIADMEIERNRTQLEWELSILEADDLRSHAWYHGNQVDRIGAERLLRQYVKEEHGYKTTSSATTCTSTSGSPRDGNNTFEDSDGLEDFSSMSSDSDFGVDDSLVERGVVPDPLTATSSAMEAALLLQQHHRLPMNRTGRSGPRRRHYYCFLVRDSTNVRPPGRYVVSCLRVDKYDNDDEEVVTIAKQSNTGSGDEQKRSKFLRRQRLRRQRRQMRHPVLHFVINEIILQQGTVYEHSQFTFGDTLPTVSSIITATSNTMLNNNGGQNGQRKHQPGFDSVPDLIRYYVGGSDDNAVLSYGCGNDVSSINSMVASNVTYTEVRIRYPCNRSIPFIADYSLTESIAKRINSCRRLKQKICEENNLKLLEPIEMLPQQPPSHQYPRQRAISPQSPSSHWTCVSTSIKSSTQRIPSATVTSATISSQMSSSSAGLETRDLEPSITLLQKSLSLSDSSRINPRPSTPSKGLMSTTLPCQLTSLYSHSPTSESISLTQSPQNSELSTSLSLEMYNLENSSFNSFRTSDLFSTPSASSMCEPNIDSSTKKIIDMDEEIVAALHTTDGCGDSDGELIEMFNRPPLPDVRSSFARSNVINSNQSKLESHKNRPNNYPSKSGIYRTSGFGQENCSEIFPVNNNNNCNSNQQKQYSPMTHSSLISNALPEQVIEFEQKLIKKEFRDMDDRQGLKCVQYLDLALSQAQDIQSIDKKETCNQVFVDKNDRSVRETGEAERQQQIELDAQPIETNQQFIESDVVMGEIIGQTISDNDGQSIESIDFRRRQYNTAMSHRLEGSRDQRRRQKRQNLRRQRQLNSSQQQSRPQESITTLNVNENNVDTNVVRTMSNFPGVIMPKQLWTTLSTRAFRSTIDTTENLPGTSNQQSQVGEQQSQIGEQQSHIEEHQNLPMEDQNSSSVDHQSLMEDRFIPMEEHRPQEIQSVFRARCQLNHHPPGMFQNIGSPTKCRDQCTNEVFGGISLRGANTSGLGKENCFAGPDRVGWSKDVDYANIITTLETATMSQTNKIYSNKSHYISSENNIQSSTNHNNNNKLENAGINSGNYENISNYEIKNDSKIHHQYYQDRLFYDNSFSGNSIASALRSIHLTIIGDPEDNVESIPVVGTRRLAAALCRADGQTTVLPYRQYSSESESEERPIDFIFGSCPLQRLGQAGPQGRRARLDVIERFACLQYLVEMTVIVTPCLVLIGNDDKDHVESSNQHFEWSLEDEYEYRRRRFYYRCAGAGSLYLSREDSSSDDDGENDELIGDSNHDYDFLPSKEEWAVERRYWLEKLARQRAAALDKWIRTAADVKQAVGDVYGYRALMSALCSDRIQTLRDAWASLRQLHTATAVAFESRLRPEFLGRRDKQTIAVMCEGLHNSNDNDDNHIEILQLPPNATIPDPTAVAVLYEYMYSDEHHGDGNSDITTVDAIDKNKTDENNLGSRFLITSPLLQLLLPWSSSTSCLTNGLGVSASVDYGLHDLHILCSQYSEWIQQNCGNDNTNTLSTKTPMLQLDQFRRNFRVLLRQYGDNDIEYNGNKNQNDNGQRIMELNKCHEQKNDALPCDETNHSIHNCFAYETHYEDKVEEYGSGEGDYDDCGDDEDDDATVICCSNRSSMTTMTSVPGTKKSVFIDPPATTADVKQKRKTIDSQNNNDQLIDVQEEENYWYWIKEAGTCGQVRSAPLDTIFRTELHVRLFWPPTIFLKKSKIKTDTIDQHLAIPAYALGITYPLTHKIAHSTENHSQNLQKQCLTILNQAITKQLDRAANDMRLRYKIMDDFLDGACKYSTSTANVTMIDQHQLQCMSMS